MYIRSTYMKCCLLLVFVSFYILGFGPDQETTELLSFRRAGGAFGFMLGFNRADFSMYQKLNAFEEYGLISVTNAAQPGGQLGIVTTIRLGSPTLRLRFLPSLSFQERALNYKFVDPDEPEQPIFIEERIGSTNLDFPLMFQFRTLRLNNFATYVLLGAQYSLNLQSQAEKSQSLINPFIKIVKDDFQGQAGLGVEFFAPYFKFGIELKFSHGIINTFIQDNTKVSSPIDILYNKV